MCLVGNLAPADMALVSFISGPLTAERIGRSESSCTLKLTAAPEWLSMLTRFMSALGRNWPRTHLADEAHTCGPRTTASRGAARFSSGKTPPRATCKRASKLSQRMGVFWPCGSANDLSPVALCPPRDWDTTVRQM